ncbi:MAG: hypothetical protein ACRD1Z_16850, partial [Vicinamibacteria bacterium]
MSPPAAIPLSKSQKLKDVMPAVPVPFTIEVSNASQLRPRSLVRSTREDPAPVPTYAVDSPTVTRQVPLAANPPSPGRASGRLSSDSRLQFSPSEVSSTTSSPSTESPYTRPCSASQ